MNTNTWVPCVKDKKGIFEEKGQIRRHYRFISQKTGGE